MIIFALICTLQLEKSLGQAVYMSNLVEILFIVEILSFSLGLWNEQNVSKYVILDNFCSLPVPVTHFGKTNGPYVLFMTQRKLSDTHICSE